MPSAPFNPKLPTETVRPDATAQSPATVAASRRRSTPGRATAERRPESPAHPLPVLRFPDELPVSARRAEIAAAIVAHQVVIVCGETGSGKTTQLPKICLSIGRGRGTGGLGLIGHTQPRRIAASATARRIAEEIGSPLGEHVGFKVRFNDQVSSGASVKLMTDGILLAETQGDPDLLAYDTLIIDEAHERSLNIDFLLGYLKRLLPRRPDLKLIITSATIDAERFSRHFGDAPVIEVSGRMYPVTVLYRPVDRPAVLLAGASASPRSSRSESGGGRDRELQDAIVDAVDELCALGPGDVLVFLPGEREIRDAAEALRKHHPPHVEILPLFARLSTAEQERVFRTSGVRRIVLATNVAETSLTVPGIRFVVDTGLARVKRYSYRNKVEQLLIEPIAQSAANQRSGRCGRVAAGVCVRLYDEAEFERRARFTDPEILRASLAAVILRMKALGLGEVESFPFIEPPAGRAVADGYQLLGELGAVDDDGDLTKVGRELSRLPLDPRIGRIVLAGRDRDCLAEMLIIASGLAVQDPRDRPLDQQEAADQAHRKFADERSEFMASLKLWQWFDEAVAHKKSNRHLRDTCRAQFISQLRMREWRDVHSQLLTLVREAGWRMGATPATYEQIHTALLSGLLGSVAHKVDGEPHYLGARGIKPFLWPGSSLARKSSASSGATAGRWIMAAEMVETTRLYARTVARIEPEWIERVGAHLLKKSWSDPHWEKSTARVVALERGTLYGLVVYAQRRVDFGVLDAVRAREIFIREALVAGLREDSYTTRAPFFAHNRRLVRDIEQLEHKTRRPDVMVDDALIEAFYERHIPGDVRDGDSFERWLTGATRAQPRLLFLERDALMRHEAEGVTSELFPKLLPGARVPSRGTTGEATGFALSYHFEPGSLRDGVTLTVPLLALNQIDATRCAWLVPGMIKEKVHLLLKSLPQRLRRHCVPLPDYAADFVARHEACEGDLMTQLIADVREQRGVVIQASDFKPESLPAHLTMNFKVVDEHGRQLAMGRSLAALRAELGSEAHRRLQQAFLVDSIAPVGHGAPVAAALAAPSSAAAHTRSQHADQAAAGAAAGQTWAVSGESKFTDWTWDTLPEIAELRQDGQAVIGYPALVDRQTHCVMQVFEDSGEALRCHRQGLRRLFMLKLSQQLRQLERNVQSLQQMALHYMSLGSLEDLRDEVLMAAVNRACLSEPLPQSATAFAARCNEGKARLGLLVNELARLVGEVLTEYAAVQKKIASIKSHAAAYADMQEQLRGLIHAGFITATPYERLSQFPRYLRAVAARVDKLRNDAARDARLMAEMLPLRSAWLRAVQGRKGGLDSQLDEFRWLLEELRVALFAQELRTPMPISVKRLTKVWASLER